MKDFNEEMARRVWQRVQGEAEPVQSLGNLQALLAGEVDAAAVYARLGKAFPEKAAVFRKLSEDCRKMADCLVGIRFLESGQRSKAKPLPAKTERIDTLLRRCYFRCLQSAEQYGQRKYSREYGSVFAALMEKKQEHCLILLEILGSLAEQTSTSKM